MYANRYASLNSTHKPDDCSSPLQESRQPVTTERTQRYVPYQQSHGINIRTEHAKVDNEDIRWLG